MLGQRELMAMRCRCFVLCAALLLALVTAATAQVLVPRVDPDKPDLPPLECRTQTVSVDINNQVARVHIEQVFVNNTSGDLECVYYLPLHESATISRFSYWVKGKEIEGKVHEKEEARQIYDQLVARKRDPALLEQAGRNLFRANIFPVSPTEKMRVVVEYSQVCDYDNGVVNFRFPLTAGGAEQKVGQFAISLNISDQKTIKRVWCPAFSKAEVLTKGDHNAQVSWESSNFIPKQDFELNYELQSSDLGVSFLTHRPEGQDGYFMLTVAPQEQTTEADVVRKDMVFVFDKSGSMSGEKIDQAKQALKFCITHLNKNDRFGLVMFSDQVTSASDKLIAATPEEIRKATKQVEALQADGSTDINAALLTALKLFGPDTNQKTIIFLTDGLPTSGEQNTGAIIRNVKEANKRGVRLFTFGVGDDVDDYLLLKLATDNHGAQQSVRAGESIEAKVSTFYAKVSTPLLINLALDYGGAKITQVYPSPLPDVFKGRQLMILGRYTSTGPAKMTLSGEINGKPRSYGYDAAFPEKEPDNSFIARLWAKARVDWAVDQMRLNGENKELKDEVIALSKEYMFITPYTSFLALPKEEAERLNRAPAQTPATPMLGVPAAPSPTAAPVAADPLIRVLAAPDTRGVMAVFPWGQRMNLVLKADGYWQCRFVVPAYVPHGDYDVVLLITRGDGTKQRLVLNFEADEENPGGSGSSLVSRTQNGWTVRLAVEATDDTSRAEAILPGGEHLPLSFSDQSGRWEASFPLQGAAGTSVMVPVILFDRGHNRITLEIEVELR
jgi:Ca-activated chloride channel family protein